jgi:hypothetical protein
MTEKSLALPQNNATTLAAAALLAPANFDLAQRMATAISKSSLIPTSFQNNLPNCLIALEMAARMGASPMAVMQNLYIVHGKPAWSSQFIIAAINSTGHFSPLRFRMEGEGDKRQCTAWAVELGTNEKLEGPPSSIAMAKAEGWFGKNGSKWQTMPELMLRYRAATFFGRLYAPEVLMGMKDDSEVIDVEGTVVSSTGPVIESPKFSKITDAPENPQPTEPESKPEPKKKGKSKEPEEQNKKAAEPSSPFEAGTSTPPVSGASGPFAETIAEIDKRLAENGYTREQLLTVAKANEWATEEQDTLEKIPLDQLYTFIEEWDSVSGVLDSKFANKA